MKKTLLTIALAAASLAAFAQGKVSLQNDGGSLYVLASASGAYAPQDAAVSGMPIAITGPLPSGVILEVGLYGGSNPLLLTLQTEVQLNPGGGPSAGQPPFTHVVLGNMAGAQPLAGGTLAYFQVAVWNSFYPTPQLAMAAGLDSGHPGYFGFNNVFSMTPSSTISYPPINGGGGSTWVASGDEQPLMVMIAPEPSTFALAGLGAAALLIFRRRK